MKHFRVTRYTTSDWLRQFAVLFVFCFLVSLLFTSVSCGHYVYAAGYALGIAGWVVIYLNIMRRLRERNPQD